ncbi:hypothetical protein L1987_33739 [Smallanthus sonchifolius]|uniref:Uncharacterized protein n=1 Tax=Smallanthus sonchifolius TaxID=185202 RepID=A0ACB9HUG3_9ASTR|nr:hypothetical protein L1987_33739 [Smallanthus sonchifolius]
MVRSMMCRTNLPHSIWSYALMTVARIVKLAPTKKVNKTPYEIWHGSKPNLSYLRVWGCDAYVTRDSVDKLDPRGKKVVFVGYYNISGHYFYHPDANVISIKRKGHFLEKEILERGTRDNIVSVRTRKEPDRYLWHVEGTEVLLLAESSDEPTNYKSAISDPESTKWLEAMNAEMQSMRDNQIKEFGFVKNEDEPCVYRKASGSTISFLILYVDDILIIGNNIPMLKEVKHWLGTCFTMKDLGEAAYIVGIKIYRDRSKRLLGLSQGTYIDKVMARFHMENSKKGGVPMTKGTVLNKSQSPSTDIETKCMASICFDDWFYHQSPGIAHWTAVKNILKYLSRTKDMFLIFGGVEEELIVRCYTDASFQTDRDDSRSQSGFVFTLNGGAISRKSSKKSVVTDSTTESEYIVASDAAKYILRKFHYIREIMERCDIVISKVDTDQNLADPFTKPMTQEKHDPHKNAIGLSFASNMFDLVCGFIKALVRNRSEVQWELYVVDKGFCTLTRYVTVRHRGALVIRTGEV